MKRRVPPFPHLPPATPRRAALSVGLCALALLTAGCRDGSTGKPCPGYTLIQRAASMVTELVDMEGRVVHRWTSDKRSGGCSYLLPDGSLLQSGVLPVNSGVLLPGFTGMIRKVDWDGKPLWSFFYTNGAPGDRPVKRMLHHDFILLPTGNLLLTGEEIRSREENLEAGRAPERKSELGLDFLIEIKPAAGEGGTVVWEWSLWDHLIQDLDPGRKNHGIVGDHPELVDINCISQGPTGMAGNTLRQMQSLGYVGGAGQPMHSGVAVPDSSHVNSLSYDPATDQLLLTSRNLSEILVIDHATTTEQARSHAGGKRGRGGDILYRWGNPQNYHRGKPSDQQLFGPHDAQWIPPGIPGAGNALIFNNGDGRRDGAYSSVEEIRPPRRSDGLYDLPKGKAYGPERPTWRYVAEPKSSFYSQFLSGAQRLPNGNTLVCSGTQSEVFEVDRSGRRVWGFRAESKQDAPPGFPGRFGPPTGKFGGPPGGFGGPSDDAAAEEPPAPDDFDEMAPGGLGPPPGGKFGFPPGGKFGGPFAGKFGGPPGGPPRGGLFRATRYPIDYPAFRTRALAPLEDQ